MEPQQSTTQLQPIVEPRTRLTEPLELEVATHELKPVVDKRMRIPEPLPVRLVAVDHVRLPAPAGVEVKLDAFYAGLLEFERIEGELAYRADNFILRFDVSEAPVPHESLRPQQIEVLSLADLEKKLIDLEIEYSRQRGLMPGDQTLLLLDPAGNWVEILEYRIVA
jgi:hypothetical protein